MKPALKALVLAPEGGGELAGEDVVRGEAENPVCGDRLVLFLRVRAGRVAEARWRATACPASAAVAEVAARRWRGLPAEATRLVGEVRIEVARLGGLDQAEGHALDLLAAAAARALPERSGAR